MADKIVYVTTGLSTGGAEIMLYNLVSRLNRDRFTPVVLSLMDRGTIGARLQADIPVYTLEMKPGTLPTLDVIWRLVQLIRQIQPDLIQGWMYHGNLAAQLASIFLPKIPVFWSIHHSIAALKAEKQTTQAMIKLGAKVSQFPKNIIFVSHTSKAQHQALGYCRKNSCVIPNGFDTSLFMPSPQAKLDVRRELNLADNVLLIGLICRYHPMKDHANFIQAAALLRAVHPNVHFLLAGTEVNHQNQSLQQLIDKLKLTAHVHLLGERSDIPQITGALDIATSASAYGEAFPLIIGEAMACGIPCVVTNVGDANWIVGDTGIVVPPKNPQALADAWQELIANSQRREILGKAARERIVQHFTLDAVVAQYQTLYA